MKKFAPIISGILVALIGGAFIAHADISASYTPLAPLPIGPGGSTLSTYTMSTYLAGAIKLIIALGAGLAVIMSILAGVEYVAKGISPSAKMDAKEKMINAFIGLALVLTSYLILNSINPDLVNFNLALPPVGLSPMDFASTTSTTGTSVGANGTIVGPWPDDSSERALLTAPLPNNAVVSVYTPDCTGRTDQTTIPSHCTSVYQLPTSAINGVRALATACNCSVAITGGTEWGHQTHGPGQPMVDLHHTSQLDNYIKSHAPAPTAPAKGCGVDSANHYYVTGPGAGTYVAEGTPPATDSSSPHWHVCY